MYLREVFSIQLYVHLYLHLYLNLYLSLCRSVLGFNLCPFALAGDNGDTWHYAENSCTSFCDMLYTPGPANSDEHGVEGAQGHTTLSLPVCPASVQQDEAAGCLRASG